MNLRVTLFVLLAMLSAGRADEAAQFPLDQPNPADFARAINYYVALGEKQAVRALHKRARHDGFRTSLLCRVLFEPKPGRNLREPLWGGYTNVPTLTMKGERWPLLPLALSGKTYFIVTQSIMLSGVAEDFQDYVSFCRSNGILRKAPVSIPTRSEARQDALALRQSLAWKSLKWTDKSEGTSYELSEQDVWENIKVQAEAVKSPRH